VIHGTVVKNAHKYSWDKWLFTGLWFPRIEELFLAYSNIYERFAELLVWFERKLT